jgi:hypothetical protein
MVGHYVYLVVMFACQGCKNSVKNGNGEKVWCSAQKIMIAVNKVNGEHLANCTFYEKT